MSFYRTHLLSVTLTYRPLCSRHSVPKGAQRLALLSLSKTWSVYSTCFSTHKFGQVIRCNGLSKERCKQPGESKERDAAEK